MHVDASKASLEFPGAVTPRSKVWLEVGGRFAVGEWGIALLEGVRRRGSLRQAAVTVGWSYRHAWDYVQQMEAAFGRRLIQRQHERPREGSRLTSDGEAILQALRRLQQTVQRAAERSFRTSNGSSMGLRKHDGPAAKPRRMPEGPALSPRVPRFTLSKFRRQCSRRGRPSPARRTPVGADGIELMAPGVLASLAERIVYAPY